MGYQRRVHGPPLPRHGAGLPPLPGLQHARGPGGALLRQDPAAQGPRRIQRQGQGERRAALGDGQTDHRVGAGHLDRLHARAAPVYDAGRAGDLARRLCHAGVLLHWDYFHRGGHGGSQGSAALLYAAASLRAEAAQCAAPDAEEAGAGPPGFHQNTRTLAGTYLPGQGSGLEVGGEDEEAVDGAAKEVPVEEGAADEVTVDPSLCRCGNVVGVHTLDSMLAFLLEMLPPFQLTQPPLRTFGG